jgi:hypothetical protein
MELDYEYLRVLNRRKEKIRSMCHDAEEVVRAEWENIWQSTTSSDILPGLPDELVETKIWPILRRWLEDVQDLPNEVCVSRILQIRSMACISRKWRHIVTTSKAWAAIRLIVENVPQIMPLYALSATFRLYMMYIPPIDAFSRLPLKELRHQQSIWMMYNCEETHIYLELYSDRYDPKDSHQRLLAYRRGRDLGPVAMAECPLCSPV